ncbi:MAG: arsenate reductase ArsC [Candidatus Thorarchaeota archaeon]
MKKVKVLFICGENRARSQIAEAFLRHYGSDRYDVYSAGLEHSKIHPLTVEVMKEIGYDLGDHFSKNLRDFLGSNHFSYVITVCNKAKEKCPIFPGGTFHLHWSFDDPVAFKGSEEEKVNKFREVRDQIQKKVINWLKERGELIDASN